MINTNPSTASTTTAVSEGAEIITVGRFGSKCANFQNGGCNFSLPIWSAKKYVAKRNEKGRLKWFFVACFGRTVSGFEPSDKFVQSVKDEYSNYGAGITHLMRVKDKLTLV